MNVIDVHFLFSLGRTALNDKLAKIVLLRYNRITSYKRNMPGWRNW